MLKDFYKILEVNETASNEVINAAYKTLVKRYHPDLAKPNEKSMKEEKMKDLNLAKDTLLDPDKRAKYDIQLRQEREKELQKQIKEQAKIYYRNNVKGGPYRQEPVKEKRKKKTSKASNDMPSFTIFETFKGFFNLFSDFNKNKGLILICSGLFLVAFLQVFLVLEYSFGNLNKNANSTNNKHNPTISQIKNNELFEIKAGLSKDKIIQAFGIPDKEFSAYIQYGDAKILLQDNYVIGWIDTYEQLPIKRHIITPTPNTLKVGSTKEEVLQTYGTPDTYSRDILVYDNVIIYFDNDIVTGVEYMK